MAKDQPNSMLPRIPRTKGAIGIPEISKGTPSIEFLYELAYTHNLKHFRKMRYNDPIIGGIMLEIELLFTSLHYEITGENADLITDMLERMDNPFAQIIGDTASAAIYGFYIGEMLFRLVGDKIYLSDVEPRFQETVTAINDADGNVIQETDRGKFTIPYKKCLHHTFIADSRNPYGISLLRHIYKPYYFKTSVEAVEASAIDRDLTGLPMLETPPGFDFTKADESSPNYDPIAAQTMAWAIDLVSNIRTDSQQGLIIPNGWKFSIVRGENRATVPTTDIINRYNTEMVSGLLAQFLFTAKQTDAQTQITSFMDAVDALAVRISISINKMFKQICALNNLDKYPKISFRKLRREQIANLASYVARLTAQGLITPTVELEERLLKYADLPIGQTTKEIPTK